MSTRLTIFHSDKNGKALRRSDTGTDGSRRVHFKSSDNQRAGRKACQVLSTSHHLLFTSRNYTRHMFVKSIYFWETLHYYSTLLSIINTPSLVRTHTTNFILQTSHCCTPHHIIYIIYIFRTKLLHTTTYYFSYCYVPGTSVHTHFLSPQSF